MTGQPAARRSGILVPLFSLWSSQGWGIGEIGDIAPLAQWLRASGQRVLQLLPINEMPPDDTSPYSALSAMALDPLFITLAQMEDFAATGGEGSLSPDLSTCLAYVRSTARISAKVDYPAVRALKHSVLRQVFARFLDAEWRRETSRAQAFRQYMHEEAWWLDDYALFRALHEGFGERPWTEWTTPLRDRDPRSLAAARQELAEQILFRQYLQWTADQQWRQARRALDGVALFGDLPFMVSGDSADVWAHQREFRLDASLGVPPDAFSATGQDWNLPVYRWDVVAQGDFSWLRARARRNASLYDGYRVDHVVGFYRTYFRPHDGADPQFTPADQDAQAVLGERVLGILRGPGAEITAEDLGVVPDFVRESLARLGIPGYKVFRWEREWHNAGQPFVDPLDYPAVTVATSGTHDTEPMAAWWAGAGREERSAVLAIPSMRRALGGDDADHIADAEELPPGVHRAILRVLSGSGSGMVIFPVQDVFGWGVRINTPATVSDDNWTWRLPWPVDRLQEQPQAVAVAAFLKSLSRTFAR